MPALKSPALPRKIILAFALTAATTVAGGALTYRQIEAQNTATVARDALLDRTRLTERLAGALLQEAAAADVMRLAPGSASAARFNGAGAEASAAFAALTGRFTDATDGARLERLKALEADFRTEAARVAAPEIAPAAQPQTRARTEAPALAAPALDSADSAPMMALVGTLRSANEAALFSATQDMESAKAALSTTLFATLGAAVLATLLAGGMLMRSLATPLRRSARALSQVTAGDLSVDVPNADRSDEIGMMARAAQALLEARSRIAVLEADASRVKAEACADARRIDDDHQTLVAEQATAVRMLEDALARMSAGDLTCRIEGEFPARYARLREEFNAAATHLHDMVSRVASSVSSIANGTSEIGHAADDLSRRTEQQAASLDKTASALDEITATVKHSAENAASVASSVAAARQDTERSGEVMREAVEAMNAIQKSSQQIARIIGVIDEIAFQTNLLALNAGVEAARAGDAGRGFAVVALEVRALAQRSSEAAKEIKTLIGASSSHVGNGVDLVNRSGEVLTRIAAQVTQIDALVQEIAGSAREQSIGIADVNDAVNKMDRVTQQNAAMVEETTAATLSLRTETEELGRMITSFQVDGTNGAIAQLRNISAAMKTTPKPAPVQTIRAAAPAAPVVVATAAVAAAAAPAAAEDLGWEEF